MDMNQIITIKHNTKPLVPMARRMSTKQKVFTSQKFMQSSPRMRRPLPPTLLSFLRLLRIPSITPLVAKHHMHLKRRATMKAQMPAQIIQRRASPNLMPLLSTRQRIRTLLPPSPTKIRNSEASSEERRPDTWIMYSQKNTANITEKIFLRNWDMTKRWVMEKAGSSMRQQQWTSHRWFYLDQTSMKCMLRQYHHHRHNWLILRPLRDQKW